MMREIPLSRGHVALIDDEDFDRVSRLKWCLMGNGNAFYAGRGGGGQPTVRLHRFLLDPQPGMFVDHINGDRLDNRRANLRLVTPYQNCLNRRVREGILFKGVFSLPFGHWGARIGAAGKRRSLGWHKTAEDAARAYDVAAIELHGEFACLNFPEEGRRGCR